MTNAILNNAAALALHYKAASATITFHADTHTGDLINRFIDQMSNGDEDGEMGGTAAALSDSAADELDSAIRILDLLSDYLTHGEGDMDSLNEVIVECEDIAPLFCSVNGCGEEMITIVGGIAYIWECQHHAFA